MTENPQPLTEERLAEMERRAKNAGYAGRSSWSEDVPALVAEVRRLQRACSEAWAEASDLEHRLHHAEDLLERRG